MKKTFSDKVEVTHLILVFVLTFSSGILFFTKMYSKVEVLHTEMKDLKEEVIKVEIDVKEIIRKGFKFS